MTTKGLEMEAEFFEALKKHFYIMRDEDLDRNGIDGLIVGIKSRSLLFEEVLCVQITTRRNDAEKLFVFLGQARRFSAKKTVYVEIAEGTINPGLIFMAATALESLFFDRQSPTNAIITLDERSYRRTNADTVAEAYQVWLQKKVERELFGVVTSWQWRSKPQREKQEPKSREDAEVTKSFPNNVGHGTIEVFGEKIKTVLRFFVSSADIDDRLLRELLKEGDDLKNRKIFVVFEDGGCREGYSKKTAKRVEKYEGTLVLPPPPAPPPPPPPASPPASPPRPPASRKKKA